MLKASLPEIRPSIQIQSLSQVEGPKLQDVHIYCLFVHGVLLFHLRFGPFLPLISTNSTDHGEALRVGANDCGFGFNQHRVKT